MIYTVSRKRSFIKSITWRTLASLDTFIIAWLVTGKTSWACTIAVFEILTKKNIDITSMRNKTSRLEELFLKLLNNKD